MRQRYVDWSHSYDARYPFKLFKRVQIRQYKQHVRFINRPNRPLLHIKTQLDSEAKRTQSKEMNKHGHLISFVSVPKPHRLAEFSYIESRLLGPYQPLVCEENATAMNAVARRY